MGRSARRCSMPRAARNRRRHTDNLRGRPRRPRSGAAAWPGAPPTALWMDRAAPPIDAPPYGRSRRPRRARSGHPARRKHCQQAFLPGTGRLPSEIGAPCGQRSGLSARLGELAPPAHPAALPRICREPAAAQPRSGACARRRQRSRDVAGAGRRGTPAVPPAPRAAATAPASALEIQSGSSGLLVKPCSGGTCGRRMLFCSV
mmetsp:Transcript_80154/g.192261  ORF Transcript_80154/g.192261 Transcript_80154/m.192261 type:complete len:203 (-) Transcript_80154:4-612(-)